MGGTRQRACPGLLRAATLPALKTYTYKRVGKLGIEADVRVPTGRSRCPVLLLLHGGALIAGGRRWFADYALEQYRRAGYVTVAIDYRLAPTTRGPEIISDVRDAIAWTRRDLPNLCPVDPERLALVGYSAGGYLALLAGSWAEVSRPRAVVSYYGYGDIAGDWYAIPSPHYQRLPKLSEARARGSVGTAEIADGSRESQRLEFYFYCRQNGQWLREVFGFDRDTDPVTLLPYRPICHVDQHFPPTLLLHGDADQDVPFSEAKAMHAALTKAGVASELIVLPGAGHAFDLPWFFRFRTERPFLLLSRFARPLLEALPARTFPGRPPKGSEAFIRPTLSFLAKHLG